MAALLVTVALVGVWRAAATLFGSRAGLCTAALGAVTGPVLALGHLAVIDAPAAAGLGVALWSVAELWRRDHRAWLIAGAAAYAFAVLGKYPVAACGLPLALLLVALRGRRAAMDLTLFAAVVAAVLGTYFLTERTQLAGFVGWRTANNPSFGVTPAMVAVSQLWFAGVPLALGVAGWVACRRKAVASALLLRRPALPALPPRHRQPGGRQQARGLRHPLHAPARRPPREPGPARPARRRARDARGRRRRRLRGRAGPAHRPRLGRRGPGGAVRRRARPARRPLPHRRRLALHPPPLRGRQGARPVGRRRHLPPRPPAGRPAHLPLRLVRRGPGRRAVAGGAAPAGRGLRDLQAGLRLERAGHQPGAQPAVRDLDGPRRGLPQHPPPRAGCAARPRAGRRATAGASPVRRRARGR